MGSRDYQRKSQVPCLIIGRGLMVVLLIAQILCGSVARAETLQGRVEQSDEILRLRSPSAGSPNSAQSDDNTHSLRISRTGGQPDLGAGRGLVDKADFTPLSGNVDQSGFRLGVLKPDSFALPPQQKFDLGAERGSAEMVLAWERWHHQLSQAIYTRWSERAQSPGDATVRITVTRDRHIMPTLISSTGGWQFNDDLLAAIRSLEGNPGLTFPAKSQRDHVTFEADYIAAHDVRPGYNWVKNDYEHIRQDY